MLLILTNIICIMQSDRHQELCDMFALVRMTLYFFYPVTLSFLSFCNLHNDRFDENSDNSRESKPISKVAKLDFQVIAFGHLFSIAQLMLRNAIGYLADLFDMC